MAIYSSEIGPQLISKQVVLIYIMISQKCPKCNSSRVRRGYRPTPFFLKCVCRFNLLCDTCNWEFVGWAVPGTLSSKPNKKRKKKADDATQQSS